MKLFVKKNTPYILIIIIFAIFILLRFYGIDKRINFDWDQESYVKAIKNMLLNKKISLIGPRVVSDAGFFLGPYFYYILFPFLALSKLHPIGLAYFVVLLSVIYFIFAFLIIKKIFNISVALLFLFLWAINYLLIGYDKNPWNPVFIPIGTLIVFYLLYQIRKRNNLKHWLLLGISLAFFINMHFQFIFIIVFSIIFILLFFKQSIFKEWKKILILFFGFIIVFLPLFIFDLRHDFLNIKLMTSFFASKENYIPDRFIWIRVFANFIKPITTTQNTMIALIFYLCLTILSFGMSRIKNGFLKIYYQSFMILLITIFLSLSFVYQKRPSEYYFLFLYPFICLILADFFFSTKKILLLIIFLAVSIVLNKTYMQDVLIYKPFTLQTKEKAVLEIKKRIDPAKKFNISLDTPLGENSGYKYLIEYHDIKQSGNWSDPLVQIRIPPKPDNIVVGQIGLEIPEEVKKH